MLNITGRIAKSKVPKPKYVNLSYSRSHKNKMEFSSEIPLALSSCWMFSKHTEQFISLGITFLYLLCMFTYVQLLSVLSIIGENLSCAYRFGSCDLPDWLKLWVQDVWVPGWYFSLHGERRGKAQKKGEENLCWVVSLRDLTTSLLFAVWIRINQEISWRLLSMHSQEATQTLELVLWSLWSWGCDKIGI